MTSKMIRFKHSVHYISPICRHSSNIWSNIKIFGIQTSESIPCSTWFLQIINYSFLWFAQFTRISPSADIPPLPSFILNMIIMLLYIPLSTRSHVWKSRVCPFIIINLVNIFSIILSLIVIFNYLLD